MSDSRSCFTASGHSIRYLKERASELQGACGCTYAQALDGVARSVGYSNWKAVMAEPADPDRDEFFAASYERRDRFLPEYREYLAERRLEESADAFREFLVAEFARFREMGFHRYRLNREPGDSAQLIERLRAADEAQGPEALLPQRLSDELLERLIGHTRLAMAHMGHKKGLPLPPTGHLDPIMFCVLRIAHCQKQRRNPRAKQYRLKFRELEKATRVFQVRLELEFLSRCTKVRYEPPTFESVLAEPEGVELWIACAEGVGGGTVA